MNVGDGPVTADRPEGFAVMSVDITYRAMPFIRASGCQSLPTLLCL